MGRDGMNKLVSCIMLPLVCFAWMADDLLARPCTPQEQQTHKFLTQMMELGECFAPDPHPLPYGIFYPKGDRLSEHYIYFINAGKRPVVISEYYTLPEGDISTPYEPSPGEEEGWQPVMTIPANHYDIGDSREYEFRIGNSTLIKKIPAKYMRKSGPAIYSFYRMTQKNGAVVVDEIGEKAAVNLMKNMKRSNR